MNDLNIVNNLNIQKIPTQDYSKKKNISKLAWKRRNDVWTLLLYYPGFSTRLSTALAMSRRVLPAAADFPFTVIQQNYEALSSAVRLEIRVAKLEISLQDPKAAEALGLKPYRIGKNIDSRAQHISLRLGRHNWLDLFCELCEDITPVEFRQRLIALTTFLQQSNRRNKISLLDTIEKNIILKNRIINTIQYRIVVLTLGSEFANALNAQDDSIVSRWGATEALQALKDLSVQNIPDIPQCRISNKNKISLDSIHIFCFYLTRLLNEWQASSKTPFLVRYFTCHKVEYAAIHRAIKNLLIIDHGEAATLCLTITHSDTSFLDLSKEIPIGWDVTVKPHSWDKSISGIYLPKIFQSTMPYIKRKEVEQQINSDDIPALTKQWLVGLALLININPNALVSAHHHLQSRSKEVYNNTFQPRNNLYRELPKSNTENWSSEGLLIARSIIRKAITSLQHEIEFRSKKISRSFNSSISNEFRSKLKTVKRNSRYRSTQWIHQLHELNKEINKIYKGTIQNELKINNISHNKNIKKSKLPRIEVLKNQNKNDLVAKRREPCNNPRLVNKYKMTINCSKIRQPNSIVNKKQKQLTLDKNHLHKNSSQYNENFEIEKDISQNIYTKKFRQSLFVDLHMPPVKFPNIASRRQLLWKNSDNKDNSYIEKTNMVMKKCHSIIKELHYIPDINCSLNSRELGLQLLATGILIEAKSGFIKRCNKNWNDVFAYFAGDKSIPKSTLIEASLDHFDTDDISDSNSNEGEEHNESIAVFSRILRYTDNSKNNSPNRNKFYNCSYNIPDGFDNSKLNIVKSIENINKKPNLFPTLLDDFQEKYETLDFHNTKIYYKDSHYSINKDISDESSKRVLAERICTAAVADTVTRLGRKIYRKKEPKIGEKVAAAMILASDSCDTQAIFKVREALDVEELKSVMDICRYIKTDNPLEGGLKLLELRVTQISKHGM